VAVKLGEMDVTLLPPLTRTVPVEEVYQSIVQLAAGVALKVTVPEPQRALLLAAVGAAGTAFTVAVTAVRDADTQPVVLFRACA
jgi:hypothetical protein